MRRRVPNFRTVLFPIDLLARLEPHAAKRGVTPNALARLLVETTLDEFLIDSVLDDAPPPLAPGGVV